MNNLDDRSIFLKYWLPYLSESPVTTGKDYCNLVHGILNEGLSEEFLRERFGELFPGIDNYLNFTLFSLKI